MPSAVVETQALNAGMEALQKATLFVSNFIYAKYDRNGPPSASQIISIAETRRGYALLHPSDAPTHLPHPAFSAETDPISRGHCWK